MEVSWHFEVHQMLPVADYIDVIHLGKVHRDCKGNSFFFISVFPNCGNILGSKFFIISRVFYPLKVHRMIILFCKKSLKLKNNYIKISLNKFSFLAHLKMFLRNSKWEVWLRVPLRFSENLQNNIHEVKRKHFLGEMNLRENYTKCLS